MKRLVQQHNKSFRLRMMLGILVALICLQTNAVLCACLQMGSDTTGIVLASSEAMPNHGSMPMESCHCKSSDAESQPADSGADACPLCQGSVTCSTSDQRNLVLNSSGSFTLEPILLASMTLDPLNGPMDLKNSPCSDLPQPHVRSHPLFVLNSTFRI